MTSRQANARRMDVGAESSPLPLSFRGKQGDAFAAQRT
jgi:hypothetical protein